MDAALAGKFIGMYVNDYTRDYGETGRDGDPGISARRERARFCSGPGRAGVCRIAIDRLLRLVALLFRGCERLPRRRSLPGANSFLKPGTKSLVPYSNRTTKLKVKNTNSSNQNKLRMRPTRATLTYWLPAVNGLNATEFGRARHKRLATASRVDVASGCELEDTAASVPGSGDGGVDRGSDGAFPSRQTRGELARAGDPCFGSACACRCST